MTSMAQQVTIEKNSFHVKYFNTTLSKRFYPIKITTNWNALPYQVASSGTVNLFKNHSNKHWVEYLPDVRVNWHQLLMLSILQWCTVYKQRQGSVMLEIDQWSVLQLLPHVRREYGCNFQSIQVHCIHVYAWKMAILLRYSEDPGSLRITRLECVEFNVKAVLVLPECCH